MSKLWTSAIVVSVGLLAFGVLAYEGRDAGTTVEGATEQAAPRTMCPLMGGKITKDLTVGSCGKRTSGCCQAGLGPVCNAPAQCGKTVEDKGIMLEKPPVSQTSCPMMGGRINKNLFVDSEGKRIYACCAGCVGPIGEDPAKYIKLLEDKGITLDKTPAAD